jgi:hypothetical protein
MNLLVSLWDSTLILYDTKTIFAFSMDTSIYIQIESMTVVSVLNNIVIPG